MKYRRIEIENTSWSATHDLEEQQPLLLNLKSNGCDTDVTIDLKGVKVASFDESMAMPIKAVRHDFMEEDGHKVETTSVIPFGSEPAVLRKFEYLGNIIKVTTDLRLKAAVMGNLFSIDELLLKGDWKKYAVLGISSQNQIDKEINWKTIPESDTLLYDADNLFGLLLLEDNNGTRIEIGTGFDIWRWNVANGLDGVDGQLAVELIDGNVLLKRHIMISEKEFEIPKRDWRFNWYMAWDNGSEDISQKFSKGESISVNSIDCPDVGMVTEGNVVTDIPCFHSKAGRNRLKKWLRSQLASADRKLITVDGMSPHICGNQAHLERAKYDKLLHWDLPDIIDFWFWSNRQLHKKESFLTLFPVAGDIFSEFPSFKAMGRVAEPVAEQL